jgi:hypothetical protein
MAVRREGTTAALTDNAVGMMDNAVAHMSTAATATPALRYGRMTEGEVCPCITLGLVLRETDRRISYRDRHRNSSAGVGRSTPNPAHHARTRGSRCRSQLERRNRTSEPTILDVPAQSLRAREAESELGTFATDKYRSSLTTSRKSLRCMRSHGCVRVSHPLRPCDRVGHAATFPVFGGWYRDA